MSKMYFIVILCVICFWFVTAYNRLIRLIEASRNNYKQIDIELDRRYKVFEDLVTVLKQYMDYEKSTLKDVVAMRNAARQASVSGDLATKMKLEDGITNAFSGINALFEQYPDLKANTNAMQLQEEISNTNNRLAYAKQAYNSSVEVYNAVKKSFFASMLVSLFKHKLDFDFQYWTLQSGDTQKMEDYKIKF